MFDVWLTDCQKPKGAFAQKSGEQPADASQASPAEQQPFEPRRRVRR